MAAWIQNGNKFKPIEIGNDYIKIVVVGDPRVGKTTFIRNFIRNNYPEEVTSINGVRVYRCRFWIGDSLRRVAIYEIPSHPDFLWQHKFPHYNRANIIIFMYAIDSLSSFQMLTANWIFESLHIISAKRLPVAVIGNKRDLRNNLAVNHQVFVSPDQAMGLFEFPNNRIFTGQVSSLDEYEVLQAFRNIFHLLTSNAPIQFRSRL